MATAEKTEVTKLVETTVPAVALTLSEDEAFVLVNILAKVGGTSDRRTLTDGILFALADAGYSWTVNGMDGIDGIITLKK